ncbi:MAG TPA: RNA-binding protein [Anaerolineales bacterium]
MADPLPRSSDACTFLTRRTGLARRNMEAKLYVGNLPYSATEEELSSMFGQAGTVTSVAIIKDRETGRSKGFAFVEMASDADAQKAISMLNGQNMGGRDLRVSIARPREGGGGGGRSFGNRGGGGGGGRRFGY